MTLVTGRQTRNTRKLFLFIIFYPVFLLAFLFVCWVCFVVKKELFTTNDTKHTKKLFFIGFLPRFFACILVRVFGVFQK